jgi:hypothetical protein
MSIQTKFRKPNGAKQDAFELEVSKVISEIENSNKELAAELKPLYFTHAKEVSSLRGFPIVES